MASAGKRYIIEFDKVLEPYGLYKAKGFNSLVFDEEGIRKLTPLGEEKRQHYYRGKEIRTVTIDVDMANVEEDVWCLAYEISRMPREALGEIFGVSHSLTVLQRYSYQEARKLMEEYRNGKGLGKQQ